MSSIIVIVDVHETSHIFKLQCVGPTGTTRSHKPSFCWHMLNCWFFRKFFIRRIIQNSKSKSVEARCILHLDLWSIIRHTLYAIFSLFSILYALFVYLFICFTISLYFFSLFQLVVSVIDSVDGFFNI